MIVLPLAALLATEVFAQTPLEARRADLPLKVRVTGTVVTQDIIRLKSSIEGRVEEVLTSTYAWAGADQPLGTLANKEMAAILDSHTTTDQGVVEERWKKVYRPTPFTCPGGCFVLRIFVRPKEWLKPKAVLLEAARGLRMVGRVRPEDAHWIKDGQPIEFWAVKDPSRRRQAAVAHYILDIQGSRANPGGSFWMDMPPSRYFDPGTEWEGFIIPLTKKNVIVVPTEALIRHAGAVYLPVRVSTGITTDALTEIEAGVEPKRQILPLDDARLKNAPRHRPEADQGAIDRRLREEELKSHPEPKPEKSRPLPEPEANYGEDPYAE